MKKYIYFIPLLYFVDYKQLLLLISYILRGLRNYIMKILFLKVPSKVYLSDYDHGNYEKYKE